MNTPTVTLSLFTPLFFLPVQSDSIFLVVFSVPVLDSICFLLGPVWLSLFPLLSFIHLFLHRTVSVTCYGSFLQGTTDMHDLLHCYEFTNGSLSSKCLASACCASPETWQYWTHAPSMLWPGLPKEPQANSTFYNFCSFCTSYGWLYCAEGFEWCHICLEYLFFFWVKLIILPWNHILIIQVHHCGLSLFLGCWRRLIANDFLLMT